MMTTKPVITLWCRVVVVGDDARLVLAVSSAIEKAQGAWSWYAFVGSCPCSRRAQLSLGARRQCGGGDGGSVEIHWTR
jgi:hypothetical protein